MPAGKHIETPEYVAMVRRMLRAAGRRVADGDPEDLAELLTLQEDLNRAVADAVHGMRNTHGASWADIARATGTTRQAAAMRWGKPTPEQVPA